MVTFKVLNNTKVVDLGFIPLFLTVSDPRPAVDQFNERYKHGGGWHSMRFMRWSLDFTNMRLRYPGDPSMLPLAVAELRDEQIYLYPSAWVVILQADMSWDIARID